MGTRSKKDDEKRKAMFASMAEGRSSKRSRSNKRLESRLRSAERKRKQLRTRPKIRKKRANRKVWSAEELIELKKIYATGDPDDMVKLFGVDNWHQITMKASKEGLKRERIKRKDPERSTDIDLGSPQWQQRFKGDAQVINAIAGRKRNKDFPIPEFENPRSWHGAAFGRTWNKDQVVFDMNNMINELEKDPKTKKLSKKMTFAMQKLASDDFRFIAMTFKKSELTDDALELLTKKFDSFEVGDRIVFAKPQNRRMAENGFEMFQKYDQAVIEDKEFPFVHVKGRTFTAPHIMFSDIKGNGIMLKAADQDHRLQNETDGIRIGKFIGAPVPSDAILTRDKKKPETFTRNDAWNIIALTPDASEIGGNRLRRNRTQSQVKKVLRDLGEDIPRKIGAMVVLENLMRASDRHDGNYIVYDFDANNEPTKMQEIDFGHWETNRDKKWGRIRRNELTGHIIDGAVLREPGKFQQGVNDAIRKLEKSDPKKLTTSKFLRNDIRAMSNPDSDIRETIKDDVERLMNIDTQD